MITIVFGKPGTGKTAYLTADAVDHMRPSAASIELLQSCADQVHALNAAGACFELPQYPPVYSNYPITVNRGTLEPLSSYYIDGFRLGFPNDGVETLPVLPGARIYLSEAQRYYNSRLSKDLPDWVSRFYEEHRHFGLDITLDVQRPGLIDVNIRDLCNCFVEVQRLVHKTDSIGNILSTKFELRLFDDWKFVERYLSSGDDCYTKSDREFVGNVFDHYQSRSYFNQFVPAGGQFSLLRHSDIAGFDIIEDAQRAQEYYPQSAPDGFYGRRRAKQTVYSNGYEGGDTVVQRNK